MADSTMLNGVKYALGVTGDYQDNTLTVYINEVIDFLKESGVSEEKIIVSPIGEYLKYSGVLFMESNAQYSTKFVRDML